MSNTNSPFESKNTSKSQDKVQTRQSLLDFKNPTKKAPQITPLAIKTQTAILNSAFDKSLEEDIDFSEPKIKKKNQTAVPTPSLSSRKLNNNTASPINGNGRHPESGTISANKRNYDEGQEVEILELKPTKMLKLEEENEDFDESPSKLSKGSKKITGLALHANQLSRMKSVDQGKVLPANVERPYIHKTYHMPREKTKVFWILPNAYLNYMIEDCMRKGKQQVSIMKIKSDMFKTQTELEWKFIVYYQNDKAKLGFLLKVHKNEEEEKNPDWKRYSNFSFSINQTNNNYEKTIQPNNTFNEEKRDIGINVSLSNFDLQKEGKFVVESSIEMNNGFNYDSKEKTGYVGLINAGNTCYMNSFLQTLYHLSSFTRCVLRMPIKEDENISMQAALQQIFYNLKYSSKAVATNELLKSFGWESREAWVQHDVQEFKCLLIDALEQKMSKSKELDGEITRLFGGQLINYVECIKIEHSSTRIEKFYDVQLNIKDSKNIYESLQKYTEVEMLDGDNLYDCEKLGKQEAKKGTKFLSLPPVLFFQLIRFEYDPNKDLNVKITSRFQYEETLDLNDFVNDGSGKYHYKLFSVLVHSGEGSSSGHYYAFIRPKMGQWLKFNDDVVEKAYEFQVFDSNFGGTFKDAKYNKTIKEIEETEIKNITTAYMLIYLREDSIKDLLKEVLDTEIPQRLREIDMKLQKEEEEKRKLIWNPPKKRKTELMKVYLTSFEVLRENYQQPGLVFFRKGIYDEQFRNEFVGEKKNRYKRWINKTMLLSKFLEEISEEIGIKQQEVIIYKIQWAVTDNKTKVIPLNRYFKSNNGQPCNLALRNAYFGTAKAPNTFPVLLILPIFNKDRRIFETRKRSYHLPMIDEREEKNELCFFKAPQSKAKTPSPKLTPEEIEELYNDLSRENYYLVLFKKFEKANNSLKLFAYEFFNRKKKNDLLEEVQAKIENEYSEEFLYTMDKKLNLYKETSAFGLEDLQPRLKDNIVDVLENGAVIVVDDDDRSVEQYFHDHEEKAYVSFICLSTNNEKRSLLSLSLSYQEVIEHIKECFEEFQDVNPEHILLKIKGKRAGRENYQEMIDVGEKTLDDLIKFEDKIYIEHSVIKVSDLELKFLLKLVFYNFDNTLSNVIEFSIPKTLTVAEFIEKHTDNLEIAHKNKKSSIKVVVLDGKQNRIVTIAKGDIPLFTYIKKGLNLRLEYADDLSNESDEFYIYCSQFSKSSDLIAYPFLLKAAKTDNCTAVRQKLFECLQTKKLEFEKKPIVVNEEYFNKLKVYLKFDVNTSLNKAITIENGDKEFYNYKKNQEDEDKFYLEIVHNSLVSRNSTKALKIN